MVKKKVADQPGPIRSVTEIEMKDPESLIPYEKNPKRHSKEQIGQIARSIQTFGFVAPVIIDAQGRLIAGHGRREAAMMLGMPEIPAIVVGHLSDSERVALIVADNKLTENARWDDTFLLEIINELRESTVDLDILGFAEDELEDLLRDLPDQIGGDFPNLPRENSNMTQIGTSKTLTGFTFGSVMVVLPRKLYDRFADKCTLFADNQAGAGAILESGLDHVVPPPAPEGE